MNSTIQNKNFNLTFFFISVLISIGLLAGAVYFASLSAGATVEEIQKTNLLCAAQLKEKGFNPRVEGTTIKVELRRTDNLEEMTNKLSVVLATCIGFDLESFCAGNECAVPGLSFVLKEKPIDGSASSTTTEPTKPSAAQAKK